MLRHDNPVFQGWGPKNGTTAAGYVTFKEDNFNYLPIIPLVGDVTKDQPVPAWPTGLFRWSSIEDKAIERIRALYFAQLNKMKLGWFAQTYLGPLRREFESMTRKHVRKTVAEELEKRNL